MKRQTQVKVRSIDAMVPVNITLPDKPELGDTITQKWQNIIDIIAKILDVPSGLIMKVTEEDMVVHAMSNTPGNPYELGGSDTLGKGLYCETVIGTNDELLVPNALEDALWADNPDVKLDMISYYGLPLRWPDGDFFGTVCVLDNKTNYQTELFKKLMKEFRDSMESDLDMLLHKDQIEFMISHDPLTKSYNRRKITHNLEDEFNRFRRAGVPFSVMMMDINDFKTINDTYGHNVGDEVLVRFSEIIEHSIRTVDTFGRWGGDEFLMICYNTTIGIVEELSLRLMELVSNTRFDKVGTIKVSVGKSTVEESDVSVDAVINRADQDMYEVKKIIK